MGADRPEDGQLLGWLREESLTLVETELPSEEEVRPLLAAVVKALERVAGDDVDRFRSPVSPPTSSATATVPITDRPPVPASPPASPDEPLPTRLEDGTLVPAGGEAPGVEPGPDAPLTTAEQATLDALLRRAEATAEPASTEQQGGEV